MSEIDLSPEALKQRKFIAECTNGGDWIVSLENHFSIIAYQKNWPIGIIHSYNDAAHIAANSPQAVLAMIAEIESLRDKVATLNKEADWLAERLADDAGLILDPPCGADCNSCELNCRQEQWREAAHKAIVS